MTSYKTGLKAESLAALLLRLKGYGIVAKRFKTPVGEIDLIARRGKTLVFVEVKARSTMDEALYSILPQQQARIARAAEYYLSRQDKVFKTMRFDVIALELPFKIKHIQSAFSL